MKLVDTTFVAGPDDGLAVVDVYKQSGSGGVNSYQEANTETIDALDMSVFTDGPAGDMESSDPLGDFISGLETSSEAFPGFGQSPADMTGLLDKLGDFGGFSVGGLAAQLKGGIGKVLGGDMASMTAAIKGVSDKAQEFLGFSSLDQRLGNIDVGRMAGRLANGDKNIMSYISDLPPEFRRVMGGGFTPQALQNSVGLQVGNVITKMTQGMDPDSVRPIGNIIGTLTGGRLPISGLNRGGQAALISAVSYAGAKLNMPGVFSTISNVVSDRGVLMTAARPLIQRAIQQGDFSVIKDMGASTISNAVKRMVPGVVNGMVRNMKKPDTLAQQDYGRYYRDVKSTMGSIGGDWNGYNRGGSTGSGSVDRVVNAAMCGTNPFMNDLIRGQLNENRNPSAGNTQSVYAQTRPVQGGDPVETVDLPAMTFEDEPFMLLGEVFPNASVAGDLEKTYSYLYKTFDQEPQVLLA